MRNILKYSFIIFSFALASSFLMSTFAIDLKLRNFNETLIGFALSFFGLGVVLASFVHNIIRKKFNLYFTLLSSVIIQFLITLLIFFYFNILIILFIAFILGFTNHINFLTIETHISSKYKINSGFYISLFWSSAGLGAITGSLIIAVNGINDYTYKIAVLFFFLHFIPILLFRVSISQIKIENVSIRLSKNVLNKIKYLLMCVVLFGACDAGFSSLFPSYLLEESFNDKQVGRINFLAGMIALVFSVITSSICDVSILKVF